MNTICSEAKVSILSDSRQAYFRFQVLKHVEHIVNIQHVLCYSKQLR